MPKKVQFTKEIIVREAIDLIRKEGSEMLSARNLAQKMGCSVSPIFRAYENMEEMYEDVRKEADRIILNCVGDSTKYDPAFKEFGIRMVHFAKKEPNLFRFLFMDKGSRNKVADIKAHECLKLIEGPLGLTEEQGERTYSQMWPFLCGLSYLCSRNPECFSDELVSEMLSTEFVAHLMLVKSGRPVDNPVPVLRMETERLVFRPWRPGDAETLYKYASDPDVGPRAGWPPHKNVGESMNVIRTVFNNDHTWALELKETGEAIGCMGYMPKGESNIAIGDNDAEIGYWIAKPFWDRGLCTEALRQMIDYCFNVKGFETLWSDFFVDNPASGRVMYKCGFRDTGELNYCSNLYGGNDRPVHIMKLEYTL